MKESGASVLQPIVDALRQRRDEVETTQVVARLAYADQEFARGFANAVLKAARDNKGVLGKRARALPFFSGTVRCQAEHVMRDAEG